MVDDISSVAFSSLVPTNEAKQIGAVSLSWRSGGTRGSTRSTSLFTANWAQFPVFLARLFTGAQAGQLVYFSFLFLRSGTE